MKDVYYITYTRIRQYIPLHVYMLRRPILLQIYSSSHRWDKVYAEMEKSPELVGHIWSMVEGRVQRHRLLRMTLREDFLEQLVRHCTDHAREMAEKESKINIEGKRVEMRDIQIKMQDKAFEEILGRLTSLHLDAAAEEAHNMSTDLLSACLQGVRRHVRLSRQLKEDRERLLQEVATKENAQNELRQQVASLETMISEMEIKERTLSKHLFDTQEDHKRDVTKLISHIENLIDNNQKLVSENLRDRACHREDMERERKAHRAEISGLMETLTVMQGMSRTNSVSDGQLGDKDDGLDALRSAVLQLPNS